MSKRNAIALLIIGAAIVIILPAMTVGQFGGFKGKGGGGPKGGGGGGMMGGDPARMFDFMSGGKGYIVIAERRMFKEEMLQYAQERGINNGQLTKDQYVDFMQAQNNKLTGGQGGAKGPVIFGGLPQGDLGGGKKFGGGMSKSEQAQADPAVIEKWADDEFKQRDVNGDKKLTGDEIRGNLKDNLARWDRNNDGAIDLDEFRAYYAARFQGDPAAGGKGGIASIIIEESELDLKITVLRAGKLPKNMPPWFKDLDTDEDGQVALFEWRAGKKNLDEFRLWDLNDDGFITPEECLKQQDVIAKGGTLVPGLASANRGQFGGKGGGGKRGGFGGAPNGDGTMDPGAGGGWGKGKGGGGGGKGKGGRGQGDPNAGN